MSEQKSVFDTLFSINVNGHTEKKKTSGTELTYLSWPFAWAEVKKAYPSATYEVVKQENGLPYVFDENTGYMVNTRVTIEGVTHEMWLPVMDGANKAMKAAPYQYKTRFGDKTVDAASMFDVNKAIMRCLVKNLAMFGLGLYIYAGEDFPEDPIEIAKSVYLGAVKIYMKRTGKKNVEANTEVVKLMGKGFDDFTEDDWNKAIKIVEGLQ